MQCYIPCMFRTFWRSWCEFGLIYCGAQASGDWCTRGFGNAGEQRYLELQKERITTTSISFVLHPCNRVCLGQWTWNSCALLAIRKCTLTVRERFFESVQNDTGAKSLYRMLSTTHAGYGPQFTRKLTCNSAACLHRRCHVRSVPHPCQTILSLLVMPVYFVAIKRYVTEINIL